MRLRLLGTGSADGWPNPWCECASCRWAREHEVRTQTAVLIDELMLIDCGPDVPRAATRFGVRLAGVRHLLFSHAHPDHTGPAALLWREWATAADQPLDVVGPPACLDACRAFVGPWDGPAEGSAAENPAVQAADSPAPSGSGAFRFHPVVAGGVLALGGFEIRPVAANHGGAVIGPAVLYDVTAPDGGRVLYACDTAAPLPPRTLDALTGRAFDAVLMEENNGDRPGFGDHLGLASFADVLAQLRQHGAVVGTTRVLAVHLSHRNPPGDALARRLALMGAEVHPDGAVLDIIPNASPNAIPDTSSTAASDTTSASVPVTARHGTRRTRSASGLPRPYRVLVTGGARSGKSAEAERRLAAWPDVVYVATAGPVAPGDTEWAARVHAHTIRRPRHWTTVETAELTPLLSTDGPPLLVDCLTLWLTAHLDDDPVDGGWPARVDTLVAAWRDTRRHVVAVTNEVGSGIVPTSAVGRRFRDALGRLNAAVAAESDEVWHVVAGIPARLR
ncbi:bifunctional adenosylcobinamide kinase/adenosylcobinamide-phosphate guanylyltransferase [Frankia sp. Cj5]|uniref:bifunctional adenosylcobinamide kinase/adenosylcobinamide-phosphate guanylyltransferase n=2 Tax=unclassified Frankia TaxID=2632575 RepID=UPI001EF74299|nr:bifunctional adenosylcobinamide kinase/adenosylcobinamide-phosphate guanylyltransferase [Frankia sp. Cj5]